MENFVAIWQFLVQWYWLPLLIMNITTIIAILVENGKPEKTIAWVLVILFLPMIGIVLYYLFGQKFKKDKYFNALDQKHQYQLKQNWIALQPFINDQIELTASYNDQLNDAFEYLVHTKNSIPTSNNSVDLLINGESKFEKLLFDISHAKHHIHLEYYIFEEDSIGKKLLNLLVKKVTEGITVRIIIDDFGSSRLAKRKKYYQNLGLNIEVFLPVHFTSLANSNYRNHRKIIIIDGQIGYVGGINISDKYINPNSLDLYWRDTSIRISGDAVKILQMQFWLHWQSISKKTFDLNHLYLPKINEILNTTPVTFAFSSPGKTIPYIMESLLLSIVSAKKSVELCTPYFIPTESFKTALLTTISKGVNITLLIPKKGDSAVVQAATLSFLKPFVQRGMKVYLYEKGFVHAKTVCIDQQLSYVGTTNLDSRSFLINFELSALILDKEIAKELSSNFNKDIENAILFSLEWWKNKPWYYRTFASICRLLAPLL